MPEYVHSEERNQDRTAKTEKQPRRVADDEDETNKFPRKTDRKPFRETHGTLLPSVYITNASPTHTPNPTVSYACARLSVYRCSNLLSPNLGPSTQSQSSNDTFPNTLPVSNRPADTQLPNLLQHLLDPRIQLTLGVLFSCVGIEVLLDLRHATVRLGAEAELDLDEGLERRVKVGHAQVDELRQLGAQLFVELLVGCLGHLQLLFRPG
jgi:hypothetical protein